MQLLCKFNKEFRFILRVIYIFSKYTWVLHLKGKKVITNAFQKMLDESKCKPHKIWVGKGSEFYNKSKKSWFQDNVIEMYLTHNEEKSLVAERFIRILQIYRFNRYYKYMISVSKMSIFINYMI